jgi:excinuclease ABC subunit A
VIVAVVNGEERLYSQKLACPECGASIPQLEPRSFSFNSPYGACEECAGLGSKWAFDPAKLVDDAPSRCSTAGSAQAAVSSYAQHKLQEPPRQSRIDLVRL